MNLVPKDLGTEGSRTSLIIDKGFLQGGRAQFIVLKLLVKKVGFLNVYAPNSTRGRAQIWCQL